MKNIKSKKVRLSIYKKALDILVTGRNEYKLGGGDNMGGLCLLLPCIWLELNTYLDSFIDNQGNVFSYGDTVKYFPEFGKYYPSTWEYDAEKRHKWRIDTLTAIIEQMESGKQ